jgi:multidrug resistance efflux pump
MRYVAVAGVVALIATVAAAVSGLQPALPTVDRASLVVDSVKRGPMKREVRGPGTLVPEQVRWISALTSARVERIVAQPGAEVTPDSVLIEMSNPDVQIEALQAEQALSEAQARLADLAVQLKGARLSQRGAVEALRAQHRAASREAAAADSLVEQGLVSTLERDRRRGADDELAARLSAEDERLQLMTRSMDTQLGMQQRQVERLAAIAAFQRSRVEALVVRAGEHGVLQELALQPGQWVNGGTTMAKVVGPGKLKAVLRIPETQARDVTVGLPASIDTRNGIVAGHVSRVDPAAQGGSVTVEVALDEELPAGARPDLNVDGSIVVENLEDVVFTGRPAIGRDGSVVRLFRLDAGGATATLIEVHLGRTSTNSAQILGGLEPGDQVVLSDVALPGGADRIRLK